MIDLRQRWGNVIRGHIALTPGLRRDSLCIEVSDKASSYKAFGPIKTSGLRGGKLCCKVSDQRWRTQK
jgi:hypothetical protein